MTRVKLILEACCALAILSDRRLKPKGSVSTSFKPWITLSLVSAEFRVPNIKELCVQTPHAIDHSFRG